MPVCIYPYDDSTTQITTEIAKRPTCNFTLTKIQLINGMTLLKYSDTHPTAYKHWQAIGKDKYHRMGTHRRYSAFD